MKKMFLLTAVLGLMFILYGTASAESKSADPGTIPKQKVTSTKKMLSEKEFKAFEKNILASKKGKTHKPGTPKAPTPNCPPGTTAVGPMTDGSYYKECSVNGSTGTQLCAYASIRCMGSEVGSSTYAYTESCGACIASPGGGAAIDQPADGGSGTGGIGR